MYKFLIFLVLLVYQVHSEEVIDETATDSPWQILKNMMKDLTDAANKGAKELKELLDGGYIKDQLEKLGSFYRSIANKILKDFADLLSRLENEIRSREKYASLRVNQNENNDESLSIRFPSFEFLERFKESISEIERKIRQAFKKGYDEFQRFTESLELEESLRKLPTKVSDLLQSWIRKLKSTIQSTNKRSLYSREYLDLRSRLLSEHAKGDEFLQKFINGLGFQFFVEGLNQQEKLEIRELIQELTKSAPTKQKRSPYSREYYHLRSQLYDAHSKGLEVLEKFIKSEEFVSVMKAFNQQEREEIEDLLQYLTMPVFTKQKRSPYSQEYYNLVRQIYTAHSKGVDVLEKLINGEGFSFVMHAFNQQEREEIEDLLQYLTMSFPKNQKRSSYSREYLDLRSRLFAAHSKGDEALQKLINGQGFTFVFEGLNEQEKKEIMELIQDLTLPTPTKQKRSSYSREYLDLRSRLFAASSKGDEFLQKLVSGKGFAFVIEGLNEQEKKEIMELVQDLTVKTAQ